jgi:hypothetical protein
LFDAQSKDANPAKNRVLRLRGEKDRRFAQDAFTYF